MKDYYALHKPVRNQIRRYEPTSVIGLAIGRLRSVIDPKEITEWGGYLPWTLLLIIRWVYQYSTPDSSLKRMELKTLNQLHNLVWELSDSLLLEGQEKGTSDLMESFMKRTITYQTPFQIRDYEVGSSFGRQLVMFCDLGQEFQLNEVFLSITGIELETFYELYFGCWAVLQNPKAIRLNPEDFFTQFGKDNVDRFFAALSLTYEQAQHYIRSYTEGLPERKNIQFQLNEHTPLERFPFLNVHGIMYAYSERLLSSAFINNACDIFRENNAHFSRDEFGAIFERYVERGLQYYGASYLNGEQLKNLLPKKTKAADFIIEHDESVIIIEAKSTEPHEVTRVYQTAESLLYSSNGNLMGNPIFKSLWQIITTAHHLKVAGRIRPEQRIYAVIVTYKDYMIGSGQVFWDNAIGKLVEEKLKESSIENHITPTDIFYLSIEDFDYLMGGAKEKAELLQTIFNRIIASNAMPSGRKMFFHQHLSELWDNVYYVPKYVDARRDQCLDRLGIRIGGEKFATNDSHQ